MFQRMSLRTRFVLFSLACLLPLFLTVGYFLNRSIDRNTDQLVSNEYTIASMVDRSVTSYFERNVSALQSLAALPAVSSMDPTQADPILGQASAIRSEFTTIFLVNDAGLVVSPTTNPPTDIISQLGDQLAQTVSNRQMLLSPSITVSDDTVVVVMTLPVTTVIEMESANGTTTQPTLNAELLQTTATETPETETTPPGQVVGAIGAVIRVDQLEQLVVPLARGQTEIAVTRSDEVFLATAGIRRDEAAFLANSVEPIELSRSGETGEYTTESSTGVDLIGVYEPIVIDTYTWSAIVTNPAPQTYAQGLWFQGLIVLVLAGLAILALAVVMGEFTARPLRALAHKASAMQKGEFGDRIEPMGSGEILTLSTALSSMSDKLEDQMQGIEEVQNARENQTRQMRDLLRRTLRLQEDEQRRIASEIHDAVSPLITGALYQARALQMTNGSTDHESSVAALGSVNHLLERATEELHGVIFDLRPPDLDDLGVVAAIEAYIGSIQRTSLNVRLDLGDEPPALTSEVRLGMYRIVQEALHNVMRHSGADEALVKLETGDDLLRLTIRDNGSGFDPETSIRPTSLGLLSMRERAAAIGAKLTIVSRPGGGTAIILERTHTESVMSDDVLADLISVENMRWGVESRTNGEPESGELSASGSEPVHNASSTPEPAEGEP